MNGVSRQALVTSHRVVSQVTLTAAVIPRVGEETAATLARAARLVALGVGVIAVLHGVTVPANQLLKRNCKHGTLKEKAPCFTQCVWCVCV